MWIKLICIYVVVWAFFMVKWVLEPLMQGEWLVALVLTLFFGWILKGMIGIAREQAGMDDKNERTH